MKRNESAGACGEPASDLPTPRELLIALHANQERPGLRRIAAAARWVAAPNGAGRLPELAEITNLTEIAELAEIPEIAELAAAEEAAATALGARIVTVLDAGFPRALAQAAGEPPVLTIRGRLPDGPAVAVVGSRRGDIYGLDAAERFARYLAAAGVAVISGLARGIDAAAHRGALSVSGGSTLAILGCGMGVDYPRGHAALAAAIGARGAVVSQFPCGAGPRPWHFPVRNRIIAALSEATLVVQATPRSGALTTARQAREMGRLVFALPGPVFEPLSWGPHALLRSGALIASHPEDILEALRQKAPERGAAAATDAPDPRLSPRGDPAPGSGETAAAVLGALARDSQRTAEQVAARAGIAPQAALAALLDLEVAGAIERLPGMSYRLRKSSSKRGRGRPL